MNEANEVILEKATKGKVLVGDLLKEAGDNKDVVLRAIEEMSKTNDIRVFKDKDSGRLTIRATKKFEADLTRFTGASEEMVNAFVNVKFDEVVYVEDVSTGKKYNFQVVKIAGRNFAAVYTMDGKEAGYVKYLSSTKHPWLEKDGEKKVLLFTTIGESRSLIVDGVSFWSSNDHFQTVFNPLVKEGFKMVSMSRVTKFVMSKINTELRGDKATVQRAIIDLRSYAKWDQSEVDKSVTIGESKYSVYKNAGCGDLQVLDSAGQVVAHGYFRGWKSSSVMFESNVDMVLAVPNQQEVIQTITNVMKEIADIPLNRGFENL